MCECVFVCVYVCVCAAACLWECVRVRVCVQENSAAGMRSRVIKALGCVIEADMRVLGFPDVQKAVRTALADDAVSVRDAAVDLLGKYLVHSRELAMQYFDVIVNASADPGLSVRKRAVKVGWVWGISQGGQGLGHQSRWVGFGASVKVGWVGGISQGG